MSTISAARQVPVPETHNVVIAYILWAFGFFGAHRFYVGRPITGTIWALTLGVFLIGWLIDLVLIPRMVQQAQRRYVAGPYDYNITWLLHSCFLIGVFGLHRFYLRKWITGILWLLTGGLFFLGFFYDWWTLNGQVSEANRQSRYAS